MTEPQSPTPPPRPASDLIARDRHGLAGSVSLSLLGQGGAFAVGLLCMVITARLLGPDRYGALAMFFLLLAALSQVVVTWPNLGLVRYGREELGERGRMGATLAGRLILFALCLALAGGLILGPFRQATNAYLGALDVTLHLGAMPIRLDAAALLFLYLLLNEAVFLFRSVFQTASRFRAYALSAFLTRAFILVLLVAGFLVMKWPATAGAVALMHAGALAAVTVLSILWLPWEMLQPRPKAAEMAAMTRRIFSYSWPLMLGGLSVLVVDWVDLQVIRMYRTEAEVGLYAAAYQPVTVLTHLRVAFIGALMPLLVSMAVERQHESLRWFVDEALPQLAWTAGLGLTLVAGLAEAIPLVLGAKYAPSVTPCQVLMPGVAFSILAAMQAALAQAMDRVRATALAMAALAVLNVAGDLWLVPPMGMLGAAVATTGAFAVSGLFYFPALNRVEALGDGRHGRRYAILAAFAPSVLFAILAVVLERPSHRLLACIIVLNVGLVLARVMGVFRRSTLERLEGVRMPAWARSAMRRFYGLMGT